MKRAFWTFITFWFVLSMHAQWARAGAKTVEIQGTIFKSGHAVAGTIYKQSAASLDLQTSSCTIQETNACMLACDNQITNPYCSVLEAECHGSINGGTDCFCTTFCVNSGGTHRPDEPFRHCAVVEDESR